MTLLGSLGIDLRLLAAQLVNFTLLVWILKKFLYRPVIESIARRERELDDARDARTRLDAAGETAKKIAAETVRQAKDRAAAIIREAETIAAQTSAQSLREQQEDAAARKLREQSRLKAEEQTFRAQLSEQMLREVKKNIQASWDERLTDQFIRRSLRQYYHRRLVGAIQDLPRSAVQSSNQAELFAADSESTELLSGMKAALSAVSGRNVAIHFHHDPSLRAGYRLEIAGISIEQNATSDLNHAFRLA